MSEKTDAPARLSDQKQFAERVRQMRLAKGFTIQQVADRAGLAASTVSKIERNLMAPTYDRFTKLALGLEVDVSELFADQTKTFESGAFSVARRGEFGWMETENYTYEMLFPDLRGKTMVPMMGTLKPLEKMCIDRMVSHPGQEFFMVLEGRVLVQSENQPAVILQTGESIYFDSGRAHIYASADENPARILCVCTGP